MLIVFVHCVVVREGAGYAWRGGGTMGMPTDVIIAGCGAIPGAEEVEEEDGGGIGANIPLI